MNWHIDSLAAGIDQPRFGTNYTCSAISYPFLPPNNTWVSCFQIHQMVLLSPLFTVTSSPLGKKTWRFTKLRCWGHVLPPHRSHCGHPRRALSDHDARCPVSGQKKKPEWFFSPKIGSVGTWTGFEASHFTTVRCRFTMIYPGTTRGDWSLHRGWTGAGFAGFGMDFGVRCEGNRVLEMLFPGLDDQISMVSFGVFLLMSQFQKSLDGSWYPTHFCVFIASIVYPFVQEHQIPFRKFRFLPATHACFINLCYMWVS